MLKIRFKDNKYNAVWLVEPKITIGRSATNALVVDDPQVGDVHVEVVVDNENLTLKNLLPAQPIRVNDMEVSGICSLKADDQITMGAVELIVIDPKREAKVIVEEASNTTQLRVTKSTGWSLKANHSALANRVFPLKELNVIGRASDCDISIAAAHLSRRHAQLQVIDGQLFVKDLDSANGTYINGVRVTESQVRRGDRLRFDSLSFGVIGPSDDMAKTSVRKMEPRSEPASPNNVQATRPVVTPKPAAKTATLSSSTKAATSHQFKPMPDQPAYKGKFGLIFLTLLAVAVITTLILTRK